MPQTCESATPPHPGRMRPSITPNGLPADRSTRDRAMRAVPHQRQLQPDQHHLRQLPPEGLPGHDRSQPRAGRYSADLRELPQHHFVGECHLRSLDDRFPADRRAHPLQCAQCHVNGNYNLTDTTCVLPPDGLPGHYQSEPCAGGIPADLPGATTRRPGRNATFNHATTGFPLTGCAHHSAVRAVPREQQLQL